MPRFSFIIGNEHDGAELRTYLRRYLSLSAGTVTALKKVPNEILVDGDLKHTDYKLSAGEKLELNLADEVGEYEASEIPLKALYEDDNFLMIDKIAGMTMYPNGFSEATLMNCFAAYYASKNVSCPVFRPFYRIDRNTSGIVAVAKNSAVMDCTELSKEYVAICEGKTAESGRIEGLIGNSEGSHIKKEVGHGKFAVTEYKRITTDGKHSLVSFNLLTGRTHQIRVHMSSIGHPLAGDDLYGGHRDLINRHALHCTALKISCAMLDLNKIFVSEIPDDMKNAFPELYGGKYNAGCHLS